MHWLYDNNFLIACPAGKSQLFLAYATCSFRAARRWRGNETPVIVPSRIRYDFNTNTGTQIQGQPQYRSKIPASTVLLRTVEHLGCVIEFLSPASTRWPGGVLGDAAADAAGAAGAAAGIHPLVQHFSQDGPIPTRPPPRGGRAAACGRVRRSTRTVWVNESRSGSSSACRTSRVGSAIRSPRAMTK